MARTIPVAPFDYVVFGGTGDLSLRKLLPALLARERDQQIPPEARIFAVARTAMDSVAFRQLWLEKLRKFHAADETDPAALERFLARLTYLPIDALGDTGWPALSAQLAQHPDRIRVFYLAVGPDLFAPLTEQIAAFKLNSPASRVVLEKPVGHDARSAEAINSAVGARFSETQIYRIDHYLGKETVQNLYVLRFANALFEPLWNRQHIDHVQITVSETVGLEGRQAYYNHAGAFRDMVQNHLMQLVCLIAMEPPARYDADAIRDEKLKVLRALAPVKAGDWVRGQYAGGLLKGAPVPGYLEELGASSQIETFIALKVAIDNWRWAGVPFYLRTGKRMSEKVSEIVVQFRDPPHRSLPLDSGHTPSNRLTLRLQPNEGVKLGLTLKEPGPGGLRTQPVELDMSFAESFGAQQPEAYERLLMDVVRGNQTLFMRRDEVDAAWAWASPALEAWRGESPQPYYAGSQGPDAAAALLKAAGREWVS